MTAIGIFDMLVGGGCDRVCPPGEKTETREAIQLRGMLVLFRSLQVTCPAAVFLGAVIRPVSLA